MRRRAALNRLAPGGAVTTAAWSRGLLVALAAAQVAYGCTSARRSARATRALLSAMFLTSAVEAVGARGARRGLAVAAWPAGAGFAAEVVGVASGLPFGHYTYTDKLGPRVAGVPLLAGAAWSMMARPAWVAAGWATSPARVAVGWATSPARVAVGWATSPARVAAGWATSPARVAAGWACCGSARDRRWPERWPWARSRFRLCGGAGADDGGRRMRAAVIGAGVGGLCAAVELAYRGHRVVVLEQASAAGGKCARVTRGDYRWDAGPSLLTLPHVFSDLFAATGRPLADEVELVRVEPVTRYEFADGSSVELSADLPRALEALEQWSPGAAADWGAFLGTCASIWRASERVLTGPPPWPPRRPTPGQPPPDPRDALRVRPWWTLRQLARAHARDPRLQMIIERFATYAGGDPRRVPAALAVAGYVEHAYGAWHPRGGLYELVLALVRRLHALGGELRLGVAARRIVVRHARACGVDTDGGHVPADAVVAAVDEAHVRQVLLAGTGASLRLGPRSVSGLALMLGLRGRSERPVHHLIRFPANYEDEFDDVFARRRPVRDPTLYVCAPGATDRSGEPVDGEAWFVLANAPAIGDRADWAAAEADIIDRIGVRERLVVTARRGPPELERETGAVAGAIYGQAPHGRLAGLQRLGQRVRGVAGLWLAGGTVHPGGGLPLVALGGRTVAREIDGHP